MQRGAMNKRQRGFTLVEVLITVIIMAVGLLGVAGLQLAGMRSNHSAFLRTQATVAAYDLIDRMRADPRAFNGEHFTTASQSGQRLFDNWAFELERMGLRAPTSGALGEVDCSNSDDNACRDGNCRIIIRWDDARGEHTRLAQSGRSTGATEFSICTRLAQ